MPQLHCIATSGVRGDGEGMKRYTVQQSRRAYDGACLLCGQNDPTCLDAHRLIPGSRYEWGSLVTLCSSCHRRWHAGSLEFVGLFDSTNGVKVGVRFANCGVTIYLPQSRRNQNFPDLSIMLDLSASRDSVCHGCGWIWNGFSWACFCGIEPERLKNIQKKLTSETFHKANEYLKSFIIGDRSVGDASEEQPDFPPSLMPTETNS